jgi:hypothetical protein
MARKLLWRDGQVSGKLRSSFFFLYIYIEWSVARAATRPENETRPVSLSPCLCLALFWKLWSCGENRSFHHFRPNDGHYCHFALISRAALPLSLRSVGVASALLPALRDGVPLHGVQACNFPRFECLRHVTMLTGLLGHAAV